MVVTCAQPDTATFKALNPEWQHTPELEFLRSTEFHMRALVWQKTADGHKGRNAPKPMPLPWDPTPKVEDKPTPMTIAEANKFLGWT